MEKTQIKNTPKQYHALAVITAMLGETNLGGKQLHQFMKILRVIFQVKYY